jgi:FAD binding domain
MSTYEQVKQTWIENGEARLTLEQLCIEPTNPQSLAETLAQLASHQKPLAHSQVAMAKLEAPQWISLNKFKKIDSSSAADYIVRVQTGVTFGELDAHLAQHNQMFPLRYPADMTLSQILAEDRPALESGTKGYPRDYILKSEVATPDGELTYSGADVVKNVTGYDLHKFYVGSRNAFGILTEVTLKLLARPQGIQSITAHCNSLPDTLHLLAELRTSLLSPTLCELVETHSGWDIYVQLQGATAFVENSVQNWKEKASSLWAFNPLQADFEQENLQSSIDSIRSWPQDCAVLEIVTPLSDWENLLKKLHVLIPVDSQAYLQARPSAGLIYVIAQPENFQALATATQCLLTEYPQAFMQWNQWPESVYTALAHRDSFWAEVCRWNLPSDPLQLNLLKNLKKRYDPQNILWTPELEL